MILDDVLKEALVALTDCGSHLLAHAVRAPGPRQGLRPLGVLCGHTAIEHGLLGAALYRLQPPGTGLTHSAVRHRRPVWIESIDDAPIFARRALLARHRIRSGAAFPVIVGGRVAAVVELLSHERLVTEPALLRAVRTQLSALRDAAIADEHDIASAAAVEG